MCGKTYSQESDEACCWTRRQLPLLAVWKMHPWGPRTSSPEMGGFVIWFPGAIKLRMSSYVGGPQSARYGHACSAQMRIPFPFACTTASSCSSYISYACLAYEFVSVNPTRKSLRNTSGKWKKIWIQLVLPTWRACMAIFADRSHAVRKCLPFLFACTTTCSCSISCKICWLTTLSRKSLRNTYDQKWTKCLISYTYTVTKWLILFCYIKIIQLIVYGKILHFRSCHASVAKGA